MFPDRDALVSGGPCLLSPVGGGQGLVAGPLLDVALEVFQRCRQRPSWMPNDSYDLACASAPTASRRGRVRGGQSLAMSAAALTDHVCDHWYGGTTSEPSISRLADAHSELGQRNHRNLRCSQRNECIAKEMSKVPGTTRPFRRRRTPQSFSQRRRGRRSVHWGYSRNRGPLQASRGARFRHVRVLRPADWPAAAFAPRSPRRWTLLWLPANGARRAIGRSLQTVLAGFEPAILRLDGRVDSDHGRRRTR